MINDNLARYHINKCRMSHVIGTKLYLLDFILNWTKFPNVETTVQDNTIYYCLNRSTIADNIGCTERTVTNDLKFLAENNYIKRYFDHTKNKLCIVPILEQCNKLMVDDKLYVNIINESIKNPTEHNNKKDKKEDSMLFEVQQKKYSNEAESIVNDIAKNEDLFTTRIPKLGGKPSKTYTNACKFVDDLYNGNIASIKKHYTINMLSPKDCKFDITGSIDTLKECRGDWNLIRDTIKTCISNYRLMHNPNRMPFKKEYLPKSIDKWFEDDYTNNSYFLYSLREPKMLVNRNDDKIADDIFDRLPSIAQKTGNRFVELNSNIPCVPLWRGIENITKWGEELCRCDHNAYYWLNSGAEVIDKFYKYLCDNNLSVSANTVNLKKACENNTPWVWFLEDAVDKYGLNPKILSATDDVTLRRCYEA